MAWCWLNATESKPQNVGSKFNKTTTQHENEQSDTNFRQLINSFCIIDNKNEDLTSLKNGAKPKSQKSRTILNLKSTKWMHKKSTCL